MKRPLIACLLAASVLALAPVPSRAATPAKVHQFFQVMGLNKMMADMIPTLINSMVMGLKQSAPDLPADAPDIIQKVVTDTLTPLLPEMQKVTEKVYIDNLTDEEIDASIKFYSSPVGQSMLKKMPAMMQQAGQAGQSVVMSHMGELQQRIKDELQKRHPELMKN